MRKANKSLKQCCSRGLLIRQDKSSCSMSRELSTTLPPLSSSQLILVNTLFKRSAHQVFKQRFCTIIDIIIIITVVVTENQIFCTSIMDTINAVTCSWSDSWLIILASCRREVKASSFSCRIRSSRCSPALSCDLLRVSCCCGRPS